MTHTSRPEARELLKVFPWSRSRQSLNDLGHLLVQPQRCVRDCLAFSKASDQLVIHALVACVFKREKASRLGVSVLRHTVVPQHSKRQVSVPTRQRS